MIKNGVVKTAEIFKPHTAVWKKLRPALKSSTKICSQCYSIYASLEIVRSTSPRIVFRALSTACAFRDTIRLLLV